MRWEWLRDDVVMAVHDEQIVKHGGLGGVRDEGLLASALARPQHQAAYGDPSVFDLAAAYAFGIVKNHPFLDGNKRTGLLAAYTFLLINGWKLAAPQAEAVAAVWGLAAGEIDEAGFAAWLKAGSVAKG